MKMQGAVAAIKKFLSKERERKTYHEHNLYNILRQIEATIEMQRHDRESSLFLKEVEEDKYSHFEHLEVADIVNERGKRVDDICDVEFPRSLDFGIDSMIKEVRSIQPSNPAQVSQDIKSFMVILPSILALLKFRICSRWTRFTSSLTPFTAPEFRKFAPRMALTIEALNVIYKQVQEAKKNNAIKFQFDLYLKWQVPIVNSLHYFRYFLSEIRWLSFQRAEITAFMTQFHCGIENPEFYIDTLSERNQRISANLPMYLTEESKVNDAINNLRVFDIDTQLNYEQGHPMLHEIVRIFPVMFNNQAKNMRYGYVDDAKLNQESSKTSLRKATWIPFTRFESRVSPAQTILRERLLHQHVDTVLESENLFMHSTDLAATQARLQHFSTTYASIVDIHRKADNSFETDMMQNFEVFRKSFETETMLSRHARKLQQEEQQHLSLAEREEKVKPTATWPLVVTFSQT
jgi:hypothetical protein